jgi:hypothetical protein
MNGDRWWNAFFLGLCVGFVAGAVFLAFIRSL